ncbi:synaptosomal-associated protein 29-like [Oratosquilla oratoria]|uniref:synaptosomal-associated protein 29-like n=1 Tax=Oratosquilla oratoria TaxID=337810 RepID=UPI003F768A52
MPNYNYALNTGKTGFSVPDDDMESAFLHSSSATYLAADRLPSNHNDEMDEMEKRRQDLLQQMKQVEERTLDSSKRSIGLLHESERVGVETAQELVTQREKLENTEKRLDEMDNNLKESEKNIKSIKSVFSSLKQWWTTPKDQKGGKTSTPTSPEEDKEIVKVEDNKNLGAAVGRSQASITKSQDNHPALKVRGLLDEEEDDGNINDFRARSAKVNKQLDEDLDEMASGLSRLKGLAIGLGGEINDQNQMIGRITDKADRVDLKIGKQNTDIKKILKK